MNWYNVVRDGEIGPAHILFSDEAWFHLSWRMDSHNNR